MASSSRRRIAGAPARGVGGSPRPSTHSGRQAIRTGTRPETWPAATPPLIELGKVYEQEHGLRPVSKKRSERLSRMGREELIATLLQCLLRIAKPSFRMELEQLIVALHKEEGHAA